MEDTLSEKTRSFYRNSLLILKESKIPFMLGGAFALNVYTGVYRFTKDLDVFCKKEDYRKIITLFKAKEHVTEKTDPLWIAKVFKDDDYIDIIFNSGNGLCPVDNEWFKRKTTSKFFDVETDLIPAEEMIWQKAFIQ
ncbi:MAG: nucleotidyl transferase AbiEii/AbiGii toxin family protein, partial [Patescibacteria group bacterium]|nr:nucleotidyl transferase AbiEii/AbiGii toxin family protein [Patescibacteria group bacterium]